MYVRPPVYMNVYIALHVCDAGCLYVRVLVCMFVWMCAVVRC